LSQQDQDTYVQAAAAYSTTRLVNDPIFSTMIHRILLALANLILHRDDARHRVCRGKPISMNRWRPVGNRGPLIPGRNVGMTREKGPMRFNFSRTISFFSAGLINLPTFIGILRSKVSPRRELEERKALFRSIKKDFDEMKTGLKDRDV